MALSVAEIANTTVDYFLSLKGRWRVAVAAMIYRCKELGILNADQVKYMWKQMNARSIRKREALDDAFAPFEADGTRLSRRAPQCERCGVTLLAACRQPAEQGAVVPDVAAGLVSECPAAFHRQRTD
jgi:hypothetical protein